MNIQNMKLVSRVIALALVAATPFVLSAQGTKSAAKAAANDAASRYDIFAGYSYLAPNGTVRGYAQPKEARGAIGSFAGYFNKYVGIQVEGDFHNSGSESKPNNDFSGGSGGLIVRYPTQHFTPFAHVLGGAESVGGWGLGTDNVWGPVVTAGGGLDWNLNHRFSLRLFQADYQYTREKFPVSGTDTFNNARLSAGVVFHIGSFAQPLPITLTAVANPTSVFAGEAVAVTATPGNLNPKLHAAYAWNGNGVTGNETAATVATANLAPGTYTVSAQVKEGKPGKEGLKPGQSADASVTFTVKPFEPPTLSCSASPSTIKPGETSVLTATGLSPQNRPLTYSYTTAAGSVVGSDATATFASTGAPAGPVSITCNVADDKGNTATAVATVTIAAPPAPVKASPEQARLEARLALHSVFFPTAQPKPTHPEGGLVESQEVTLKTLATDFKAYLAIKPAAHLILTGHADVRGSEEYNQALTVRRVNRAKQFLVAQGIAESNIETQAVGKEQELSQDEVKELVQSNPDLSDSERQKILHDLKTIVRAHNRRVDVTLTTTGQKSVKLYPFNAKDSITLLDEKAEASKKHTKHAAAKQ